MLGWLETALKWCLNLFYGLVGNYGIAIILVTILVRAIMFPLTFKGSQSTARMQDLQPKIQELQAKYKNNPQKLNQEMAEFYKREGYNPLSGCLPMLIQFPIFIAMYSLFNNHFDLRGASFIPGWINDLSLPEAVYYVPDHQSGHLAGLGHPHLADHLRDQPAAVRPLHAAADERRTERGPDEVHDVRHADHVLLHPVRRAIRPARLLDCFQHPDDRCSRWLSTWLSTRSAQPSAAAATAAEGHRRQRAEKASRRGAIN